MHFLTVGQMRAADQAAITEQNIPALVLMNRAGAAVARVVEAAAAARHIRRVLLIAGHGNNGGDACVAARCLYHDGFLVQVIMTCVPATLKGASREAWDEMRTAGVPYVVLASPESWDEDLDVFSGMVLRDGIIVDGVLGTGCKGAPTGAVEKAIRWINGMRSRALVVSVDLPSGMNGDTGLTEGAVVHADVTVTFARPKQCFLSATQAETIGHLTVADIGIPEAICDRAVAETSCEMLARPELAAWFGGRTWDAHKGAFGHVCVIGGADGFAHAPVLAALGAIKSGVGLLTLVVPPSSAAAAGALVPEAMTRVLRNDAGDLSADLLSTWGRDLSVFDTVVAGPGLTQSNNVRGLVVALLERHSRLVLDADALNILAVLRREGWSPRPGQSLILTPHPGEAARLLDISVADVMADRDGAVRRLADAYQAVVVLKGSGTLVCEPGGTPWLNRTGNPGMASGGMGDVLAGMVGALCARGLSPLQAAGIAVWAHGTAGDLAAIAESQTSLSATTLAAHLHSAYRQLERGV